MYVSPALHPLLERQHLRFNPDKPFFRKCTRQNRICKLHSMFRHKSSRVTFSGPSTSSFHFSYFKSTRLFLPLSLKIPDPAPQSHSHHLWNFPVKVKNSQLARAWEAPLISCPTSILPEHSRFNLRLWKLIKSVVPRRGRDLITRRWTRPWQRGVNSLVCWAMGNSC